MRAISNHGHRIGNADRASARQSIWQHLNGLSGINRRKHIVRIRQSQLTNPFRDQITHRAIAARLPDAPLTQRRMPFLQSRQSQFVT